MAGFVRSAKQRGIEEIAVVAGGDAHIIPRERHLERMHRAVKPPAAQVVAQGACQMVTKSALAFFGVVAKKEVAPRRRAGLGALQNRPNGGAQLRE